jgi:hypothetical protein
MSDDSQLDFTLLGGHPSSGSAIYASANFQDAEDSRPSASFFEAFGGSDAIQGIVTQSLSRHITESVPVRSPSQTQTQNPSTWRKRLREMMLRQTEIVLDFLAKPAEQQSAIGTVESILRKYSIRQEVDANNIKTLGQLLVDPSGSAQTPLTETIEAEIKECITERGGTSLTDLRSQVTALIDLYKQTGEKVLECESQLRLRIEKMDKLQRRVAVILELQTNDATQDLLHGMEKYMQLSARDLSIEPMYKQLLYLYQKHLMLREAIQLFKTGSSLPSEPVCAICLNDSISYAIVPCGHTFCVSCSRKMPYECGICRSKIKERMKIFIS